MRRWVFTSSTVTIIDAASLARDHQACSADGGQKGIEIIFQRGDGGRFAIRHIADGFKRGRLAKQIAAALDGCAGQEGELSANDQLIASAAK